MRYATWGMVLAGGLLALSGCQHPVHPAPAGAAPKPALKPAPAAKAPAPATPAAGSAAAAPATPAAPKPATAANAANAAKAKPGSKIVDPDQPKTPAGPGSTVNRITIHPAHPKAHERIEVSAGPILFRNTCDGVASVRVYRHRHTVTVAWTRKKIPPHAMCGMIARMLPIRATIPGLPAGHYTLVVTKIGRRPMVVSPSRRR